MAKHSRSHEEKKRRRREKNRNRGKTSCQTLVVREDPTPWCWDRPNPKPNPPNTKGALRRNRTKTKNKKKPLRGKNRYERRRELRWGRRSKTRLIVSDPEKLSSADLTFRNSGDGYRCNQTGDFTKCPDEYRARFWKGASRKKNKQIFTQVSRNFHYGTWGQASYHSAGCPNSSCQKEYRYRSGFTRCICGCEFEII